MELTKRPAENSGAHTFVSLFCGCGGFDLGFIASGFNCVAAFDIDEGAVGCRNLNLPGKPAVPFDLRGTPAMLGNGHGVDVVLSGAPCQGFSTAGQRQLDDPRNQLLWRGAELAIGWGARVFIAENVTGVLAGEHRTYWDRLESVLLTAGYKTSTLACSADALGVPQRRNRVVLLAWKTGRDVDPALPSLRRTTLRDALSIPQGTPNHNCEPLSPESLSGKIAKRIGPGQKLCNVRRGSASVHTWQMPEVFGKTTRRERDILNAIVLLRRRDRCRQYGDADPVLPSILKKYLGWDPTSEVARLQQAAYIRKVGRRVDLTHTFNGKYRRLEWDRPSLTVHTKFGDPRYFLHPTEHRGFTVREAARIQGFPDWFVFNGRIRDQFRLVGNAVPPIVSAELAALVRQALLR